MCEINSQNHDSWCYSWRKTKTYSSLMNLTSHIHKLDNQTEYVLHGVLGEPKSCSFSDLCRVDAITTQPQQKHTRSAQRSEKKQVFTQCSSRKLVKFENKVIIGEATKKLCWPIPAWGIYHFFFLPFQKFWENYQFVKMSGRESVRLWLWHMLIARVNYALLSFTLPRHLTLRP